MQQVQVAKPPRSEKEGLYQWMHDASFGKFTAAPSVNHSSGPRRNRPLRSLAWPAAWKTRRNHLSTTIPRTVNGTFDKATAYARTALATGTISLLMLTAMARGSDNATDSPDSAPANASSATNPAARSSDTNAGEATSRQSDSTGNRPQPDDTASRITRVSTRPSRNESGH